MPQTKRRSYTAAFKLQVILHAEEHGNRAAGRQFGIGEAPVRDWRKAKDSLRTTKKTKKANRGHKPRWPQLEDKLETWVLEQRAAYRGVSTTQIRLKAQQIAKDGGLPEFRGGVSWCALFMMRRNLCLRSCTTMFQKLPVDYQYNLDSFREFTQDCTKQHDYAADHIVNMDEVPLTFDMPLAKTVEVKGADSVTIQTTGHEKTHFTVVLYADVCGWVVTAWKHVNVSCIRSGFRKAKIYCSADTDSDSDMDTALLTMTMTCLLKSLHCFPVTAKVKTLRVSSLVSDLFTTYQLTILNVYNMTIYII